MTDLSGLADQLGKLTVIEAAELSKMLEERWGVSAAAPAAGAGPAGGLGNVPAAAEQTEFSVLLTGHGEKKIEVIKKVRELNPSLGLKEAKDVVEKSSAGPVAIREGVTRIEAEKVLHELNSVGALAHIA